MSYDEKWNWVMLLWGTSIPTAIWLGLGIADSRYWTSVLIMFTIFLVLEVTVWLFRVTYLAGRRRR